MLSSKIRNIESKVSKLEEYIKKLEERLWELEGQTPLMEKQDNFKARKVEDLESYGKRETV